MDEETRLVVSPDRDTPAEAEAAALPALSGAEQMAAQVAAVLDALATHLQLEAPHPKTLTKVRAGRTVPPEFVSSMVTSFETLPVFQEFGTFNPEKARRALQLREARRIITESVNLFLQSVQYTSDALWNEVALDAMDTLAIARRRASHPEESKLAAHVEVLRRRLGRTNKPKKPKQSKTPAK